ncbi:hypothetical protein INT47_007457 [Mucor saturninus]|uniref:E2 ubiquitin-conjugating enzyme n=1 Tax=Mucor saturninus TaxID=64648 RepID=A0A8H7US74_9FUNG|nr:hypothetical protein INT47_007457 [Mucor saturninus]
MLNEIATKRIHKELLDLDRDPPPGITCFPKDDVITDLEAYIQGPPDSPYEAGLFKLSIQIPDRYPFQPPQIKFITTIYHPNIDDTGRICADILKTGEKGQWKPAINLGTALTSLRQLLAAPNPDDPLDADIAKEYQLDYPTFKRNAIEYTKKFASKEAFDDEESVVQTQVEKMVIEEEEPVKKLKSSLSLSKKKSTVTSSKAIDGDNAKQHEEKSLCKQKGPEKVTIVNLGKLANFGKSTQQKVTTQKFEYDNTVSEIVDQKLEKPTKKLKLGKSKKLEISLENSEMKAPNHAPKGGSKAGILEVVTKNTLEKDRIKEYTLNNVTLEKNIIEDIIPEKNITEEEVIEKKQVISLMDIDMPPLSGNDNEPTSHKRPLDASFFSQNIIELSDTDDDLFNKPVFHSLQLSKKQKRNKLSLSKKRRS